MPIPPELSALNFGATLAKTSAITHARIWTLDLAPINRLENWGMPRAPRIGDAITAIAFPACTEDGVARPALIILDSVGVRQQSVALPAGCSSR
ncbi:hypothetical protein BRI6_1316 [plant metagenome]|uniref:Uncharacterized protein n=1 Tax=plant metagenome TaxID=1297885 RepID=A0A484V773_9ZZZZ